MPATLHLVLARHGPGALRWAVRLGVGLSALLAGYWILVYLVQDDLRQKNQAVLYPLTSQTDKALDTLRLLADVGAGGCTPARIETMRGIALLPDGIHIVLHMDGDSITCASNIGQLPTPIALGRPDVVAGAPVDTRIWLQQPLDDLGFIGERAAILSKGDYAVAYRGVSLAAPQSSWFEQEVVFRHGASVFVSPTGERRVDGVVDESVLGRDLWSSDLFTRTDCDKRNLICAVSTAETGATLKWWWPTIGLIALWVTLGALLITYQLERVIRRHWSFERRFLRNMTKRIECVYQPILDIGTGDLVSCEVLARWRDVDGRLVAPDAFLKIVESRDQTWPFTRAVVDKSFSELRQILSVTGALQINYNIFPRDFSLERLKGLLVERDDIPRGASFGVEVIEVEQLDVATLARESRLLSKHGLKTYIDDFGSGYSNLAALATLPVTGVKLDKSFGLASSDSLQARMLPNVLGLVAAANHQIIVEGVETESRLEELRQTGYVDLVQGYYFSRPLDAGAFLAWLCENKPDGFNRQIADYGEKSPGAGGATDAARTVSTR